MGLRSCYVYSSVRAIRATISVFIGCSLGLNLRKKPKKRLPSREAKPLQRISKLGSCWSLDYMSDALQNGKRFHTANVIDDCNRECLSIDVAVSLPAKRITRWLNSVAALHGYPARLRVDNAPENIAKHRQAWAKSNGFIFSQESRHKTLISSDLTVPIARRY
jgi:transposase InsO family protein